MSRRKRKLSREWGRPMQVGILLKIPFTELDRYLAGRLRDRGFDDVRPAHHPVFQFMPSGGVRLTELAARANMTKQAMGELVGYLERRGYVERVPDPTDARAQIIRRTKKGWALHDAVDQIIDEAERDWAGRIGRRDFDRLVALLEKLSTALGH